MTGPNLSAAGRLFQVGDDVLARRNDRTLCEPGSKDFVKNGSSASPRPQSTTATVRSPSGSNAQERSGCQHATSLRASSSMSAHAPPTACREHTHDVARYHPTDASGFEEGYVAVTRGRNGARLYVVDGTVAVDRDDHHSRQTERHSLDDITDVLGRRRANQMAADLSHHIDDAAAMAEKATLAELHSRRRTPDRQVATAPADTTQLITEASQARDALVVRQRTLTDAGQPIPDGLQRRIATDHRTTPPPGNKPSATWTVKHADLLHERDIVDHAERAVEARIRQQPLAHLPSHAIDALGPEPQLQRHRNAWNAAASAVAIHRARHDVEPGAGDGLDGAAELLGERPIDLDAVRSWDYVLVQGHPASRRDAARTQSGCRAVSGRDRTVPGRIRVPMPNACPTSAHVTRCRWSWPACDSVGRQHIERIGQTRSEDCACAADLVVLHGRHAELV